MCDCAGGCGRRMQVLIDQVSEPLCKACRPSNNKKPKRSCTDCGRVIWSPNPAPRCVACRKAGMVHGKVSTYRYRGCRCDDCRAALSRYAAEHQRRRRYERGLAKVVQCVVCGNDFTHPRRGQITCSPQCRKTYSGKTGSHRSRAMYYGVDYERIDRVVIYERDAWTCGVCGDPVDPALDYPHALSASLDHIVPVSRGGSHTADNLQCAHLTCNRHKSDSVA